MHARRASASPGGCSPPQEKLDEVATVGGGATRRQMSNTLHTSGVARVAPRRRANTDTVKLLMLGYRQELAREFTLYNCFGCSFTALSSLTALGGTYGIGMTYGGPVVMMWGWLVVMLFTTSVGLSMAELASAYPTSGALYYWSYKLAPPRLRNLACWMTGWILTLGQAAFTASNVYTFVNLVSSAVKVQYGVAFTPEQRFLVLLGTLAAVGVLNCGSARLTAFMTTLGTMWHLVALAAFCIVVPLIAPERQSIKYLFTSWQPNHEITGISSPVYTTLVGLLMAQWTLTGYDGSAHVAEETFRAEVNVPRAILLTILGVGASGYAFIISLTLVKLDVAGLFDPANETGGTNIVLQILIEVTKAAYGNYHAGVALFTIPILGTFFCSYQSIANNSRMVYAFARDNGMPLSSWAKRVHPKTQAPVYGVLYMLFLASLLSTPMCFNPYVFPAVTSFAVVGCYLAYSLPVLCKLFAIRSRTFLPGPFYLGPRLSFINNIVSAVWVGTVTVLFTLPQLYPITLLNMNWSSPILGIALAFSLGWYYFPGKLGARKWFIGPRANLGMFNDVLPSDLAREAKELADAEAAQAAREAAEAAALAAAAAAAAGPVHDGGPAWIDYSSDRGGQGGGEDGGGGGAEGGGGGARGGGGGYGGFSSGSDACVAHAPGQTPASCAGGRGLGHGGGGGGGSIPALRDGNHGESNPLLARIRGNSFVGGRSAGGGGMAGGGGGNVLAGGGRSRMGMERRSLGRASVGSMLLAVAGAGSNNKRSSTTAGYKSVHVTPRGTGTGALPVPLCGNTGGSGLRNGSCNGYQTFAHAFASTGSGAGGGGAAVCPSTPPHYSHPGGGNSRRGSVISLLDSYGSIVTSHIAQVLNGSGILRGSGILDDDMPSAAAVTDGRPFGGRGGGRGVAAAATTVATAATLGCSDSGFGFGGGSVDGGDGGGGGSVGGLQLPGGGERRGSARGSVRDRERARGAARRLSVCSRASNGGHLTMQRPLFSRATVHGGVGSVGARNHFSGSGYVAPSHMRFTGSGGGGGGGGGAGGLHSGAQQPVPLLALGYQAAAAAGRYHQYFQQSYHISQLGSPRRAVAQRSSGAGLLGSAAAAAAAAADFDASGDAADGAATAAAQRAAGDAAPLSPPGYGTDGGGIDMDCKTDASIAAAAAATTAVATAAATVGAGAVLPAGDQRSPNSSARLSARARMRRASVSVMLTPAAGGGGVGASTAGAFLFFPDSVAAEAIEAAFAAADAAERQHMSVSQAAVLVDDGGGGGAATTTTTVAGGHRPRGGGSGGGGGGGGGAAQDRRSSPSRPLHQPQLHSRPSAITTQGTVTIAGKRAPPRRSPTEPGAPERRVQRALVYGNLPQGSGGRAGSGAGVRSGDGGGGDGGGGAGISGALQRAFLAISGMGFSAGGGSGLGHPSLAGLTGSSAQPLVSVSLPYAGAGADTGGGGGGGGGEPLSPPPSSGALPLVVVGGMSRRTSLVASPRTPAAAGGGGSVHAVAEVEIVLAAADGAAGGSVFKSGAEVGR